MADIKFEIILRMSFFKISNTDVSFANKTLTWRSYSINKAFPITKQVRIINKTDFVIAAIDANSKTYMVYVAINKREDIPVNWEKRANVGALLFDKAPTAVPAEYFDYSNIFSAGNATKLLENIGINKYAIKLEED